MSWQHLFDFLHKELASGIVGRQLKASEVLESGTLLSRVERE